MTERERLVGGMSGYGSTAASTSDFSATELFDLSEGIASNINSINAGLKKLEIAMRDIGGAKDTYSLRDKVHNIQQSVNQTVSATTRDLQRLGVLARRADKPQKLQVERLTQAFKDVVANYSRVQKNLSEKMQAHMPQSLKPKPSEQLIDLTNAEDEEATMIANQQAQSRLVQFETGMLLEREAYINKIEADVLDVNQIMAELGKMIHEQAQSIDTVASQIEDSKTDIELGREELAKALQHQRSHRKKMFCLMMIGIVAAAILITIIVKTFR